MLIAAIVCFTIAAVLGLTMLTKWFSRNKASPTVIYTHGALAVIGLALFVIYVVREGISDYSFPLILFGLAAILGLYIFFKDRFRDEQDVVLGIGHAIMAIGGLMMLLFYYIAQG